MRQIYRLFKNAFLNFVITALGIAFYAFAPLGDVEMWIALFVLCAVEWLAISKLRERLRF